MPDRTCHCWFALALLSAGTPFGCAFEPIALADVTRQSGDSAHASSDGGGDPMGGDMAGGDSPTGDATAGDGVVAGDSAVSVICPPLSDGTGRGFSLNEGALLTTAQIDAMPLAGIDSNILALFPLDGATSLTPGTIIPSAAPGSLAAIVEDASFPSTASFQGKFGRALGFSGSGAALALDGIDPNSPLTVAAWVQVDGNENMSLLEMTHETKGMIWHLGFTPSARGPLLRLEATDQTCTILPAVVSAPALTVGRWYHVAATSEIGGLMRIFVNGEVAAEATGPGDWTSACDTTGTWRIGAGFAGGFRGVLDEVVIYSRILTAPEVLTLYERQAPTVSGEYLSGACDAGAPVTWTTFAPRPAQPYFKSLPTGSEQDYGAGTIDSTGLVASWPVAVGGTLAPGTTLDDEVAGLEVTTRINSVYGEPGRVQTALLTARMGDVPGWASADDSPLLQGVSTFSISFWYRQYSHENTPVTLIAFARGAGSREPRLSIETNAERRFVLSYNATDATGTTATRVASSSGRQVTDMEWMHLAVVGDFGANSLILYKDGRPVIEMNPAATGFPNSRSALATVAKALDQSSGSVRAWFDELTIWHRALSTAEVGHLYRRAASRLRYQVRTCATVDCDGVAFTGPAGPTTFFSEERQRGLAPAVYGLTLPKRQFFQYRVLLESMDGISPRLEGADVAATH